MTRSPSSSTIATGTPAPSRTPVDRAIRVLFRTLAIVEAFTWAGLLISMLIKYPLAGSPVGVTLFGWLHGAVWVLFVIVCIVAGMWFRWRWWVPLIGVVVSVLPFLTVPFDIWMERTGRLHQRPARRLGGTT